MDGKTKHLRSHKKGSEQTQGSGEDPTVSVARGRLCGAVQRHARGSRRQEPARPGDTSPREGSSRRDPAQTRSQASASRSFTPATTRRTGAGGSGRTGTGAAGRGGSHMGLGGGGGTEGGASSLHRPLLWRPRRRQVDFPRAFPTRGSCHRNQAFSRPCGRGPGPAPSLAPGVGAPRQPRRVPPPRASCRNGSGGRVPLPLSRLRPVAACSLRPLRWRFGRAGRRSSGCCLQLVLAQVALLEGGRGRGFTPGVAAARTGHGVCRWKPRNRRSLWASDVW